MPSAVSISFASLGALAANFTCLPAFAALQEDGTTFEPVPDPPLHAPEPQAVPAVHVTVVGGALSVATLERALGRSLQSSYSFHFFSTDRFDSQDLFRARTNSTARVHVWVDTTTSGVARLYIANEDGTRYLVRSLDLSEPVDEMDREALAQAIEWSLQALAEGSAGMSRAEAEALISESSKPPPQPPVEEQAEPEVRPEDHWRHRSTGWLPQVALLHGWVPHSDEMLATQGPLLRLGLDRLLTHHQFGLAVSAQYRYPQRHAEAGVAVEIQSVTTRIDARYLATGLVRGSGIGLRFGFGVDAAFSSHEALDWSAFEPTPSRMNGIPLLTGGLIWQVRVEPKVRFELSIGTEIDLVDTQYDVVTSGGTTTLLSRWPVRPSLSVGVELF
jgi:hypothetical protein